MQYRIIINAFMTAADATALKEALESWKAKIFNIVDEKSSISVHKCYHDETPAKPCETVYQWVK